MSDIIDIEEKLYEANELIDELKFHLKKVIDLIDFLSHEDPKNYTSYTDANKFLETITKQPIK